MKTRLTVVLAAAALVVACGDDDPTGPRNPGAAIAGTWATPDSSEILVITNTTLTVYSEEQDQDTCYSKLPLEITGRSGDTYTVSLGGFGVTLQIVHTNGGLAVTNSTTTTVYEASTIDPSTLDLCPALPITLPGCASLPQLTLGQTVNGALMSTDSSFESGEYYDLYGVQLTQSTLTRVDMSSGTLDSFLYLLDDGGQLVAFNDDRSGTTFDARIQAQLAAGCYYLVASSFDPGETGAYALTASAQ